MKPEEIAAFVENHWEDFEFYHYKEKGFLGMGTAMSTVKSFLEFLAREKEWRER